MQISIETLKKAVEKIDSLDDEGLEKLSETYVLQQSQLVGYIMSSVIEFENETLLELLLYYYNIFMDACAIEGATIKEVTEDDIDAYHDEFTEMLDEYSEKEDMEVIEDFVNQPIMLSFLANEMQVEDENGETLDEDTANMLFMVGISMIGLIDRSMNKA
jgi:DNA-binding ferritin-like protein (Dps family)